MRNWMRSGLLVLGITASATILDAPPAYAQMPVTDAGSYTILGTVQAAITGAIQTMMNNVVSKITGLQTSIQTVLTQGFTQEANYAKAQIGARQQIADASNMANAQFRRNIRNAQVRDQHILSPQACIALDSGQSMTAASVQAAKVSAAIAQVMDARAQARPGTPAWEGQAKAMEAVTQLHLARYCDEDEQTAGLCTAATPAQINADQDATSPDAARAIHRYASRHGSRIAARHGHHGNRPGRHTRCLRKTPGRKRWACPSNRRGSPRRRNSRRC